MANKPLKVSRKKAEETAEQVTATLGGIAYRRRTVNEFADAEYQERLKLFGAHGFLMPNEELEAEEDKILRGRYILYQLLERGTAGQFLTLGLWPVSTPYSDAAAITHRQTIEGLRLQPDISFYECLAQAWIAVMIGDPS